MTFFQLEDLLSQEGYENKHQPDIKTPGMWFRSIGARLLPHLLSREVWEGIQGKHTLNSVSVVSIWLIYPSNAPRKVYHTVPKIFGVRPRTHPPRCVAQYL